MSAAAAAASSASGPSEPLAGGTILRTWWPLAASWGLMGIELPLVSAVVARLPDPSHQLAAYGGAVFPIALLVEAPVIMLLSASTALSRDAASYQLGRAFMHRLAAALTAVHVLLAFTPLFDLVVVPALGVPAEIREPARIGLRIMTPWTWSIAFRRFHQGVLIRFGRSRAVGLGTSVRVAGNLVALALGYALHLRGIVVATSAVALGVVSEAVYIGVVARPVVRGPLAAADAGPPLSTAAFLRFYVPLALTALLLLLAQPIGAAGIARMPRALESLAVWPPVGGLAFLLESSAIALNEVVIALVDRPGGAAALRRFRNRLAVVLTLVIVAFAATPLGHLWFARVSGLPPALVDLASLALWFAVPLPALVAAQSYFQGVLVASRRTRSVVVADGLYLVCVGLALAAGAALRPGPGLCVGLGAFSLASVVQVAWLRHRVLATAPAVGS